MKTKLFTTTIIAMIISVNLLIGQERTDYSTVTLSDMNLSISTSSTYWMGRNYVFYNNKTDPYTSTLMVGRYTISENGSVNFLFETALQGFLPDNFKVTSCVFKMDLYAFLWYQPDGGSPEIRYHVSKAGHKSELNSIPINEHITNQMAAVSFNDTLYIFFVDDADNNAKYYSCIYSEEHSKLVLVNETPTVVDEYFPYNGIGNVAAITYINKHFEEEILIAIPTDFVDQYTDFNQVRLYRGKPGGFEHFDALYSVENHHIKEISMAQGSVKGGTTNTYNIQFGYTFHDDNSGLARREYDISNYNWSAWETLNWNGYLVGEVTWFMEFYSKQSQKITKYLLQGYNRGDGDGSGALWQSDILEYQDQKTEVPPISHKSKFFDIVLVVEGAPPYSLNGYELGDDIFDNNPLSTFEFTKENETSISATTTYSQSVEANMGVGPVTAGFKATFMESHGTSNTETVSITNTIIPPLSQLDSNGLMWYYYIAPTVVRSRWAMQDYNGDDIEPKRNLFFFEFTSPQMRTMLFDLSEYGINSPRAFNLHSYEERGVENMSGIQKILRYETDINIQAGGTGSLDLTFSESHTDSHSQASEVSLGIDAEFGIFSASASATAGVEYSRDRTTTCSNSFYIGWNLFAPKTASDTANVRKYTPISYVMKTTDSSAYFLLEGLKDYKPFFVTYEVTDIEHGEFIYFIGENSDLINKYSFSNYPNPCSDKSKFTYHLPSKSHVNFTVYNSYGQTVNMPLNEVQSPGQHQYELSTFNLPAGIYYYRMLIDEDLIMGKIIKN